MVNIKSNHYVDTVIYSVDMIIKSLKTELKQKIDKLNIGITSEQFVVLDTISYYENMYQEKLSEILQKDKSNTTRIIKVLIDKGLVERSIGKVNNRLVYMLNITDKGKEIIEENIPKIKKFIAEIFKNVTDEEVELLHSLSGKMQNDLIQISRQNN